LQDNILLWLATITSDSNLDPNLSAIYRFEEEEDDDSAEPANNCYNNERAEQMVAHSYPYTFAASPTPPAMSGSLPLNPLNLSSLQNSLPQDTTPRYEYSTPQGNTPPPGAADSVTSPSPSPFAQGEGGGEPKPDDRLIVGVDFGTTYSGYVPFDHPPHMKKSSD
jgi:hypothetical protein